ncbi:MAG: RAD52 family DNA repair protein, partial [Chloroflexota bacterium]|nr:RAD52 family DNA repair protein [Chloroflexota bacterium]
FLLQRTPKHEIKVRQGRGGLKFSYVEHGYVTERLNLVFGFNWDFEVVDKQILEDEVVVEARLTVRTPAGQTIVKTQFGGADIKRHSSGTRGGKPLSIADDLKAAASDALKKCASLLGIGLDLYGRDRVDDEEPGAEPHVFEVGSALATVDGGRSGLCTDLQLKQIRQLVTSSGRDLGELMARLQVSDLSDLTEARAERVIVRLGQLGGHSRGVEAS